MIPSRGAIAVAFVLAVLLAPVTARRADACSCMENPPCAVAGRADAVFIGTVLEQKRERVGGSLYWTVHSVAVTQPIRGTLEPVVTLVPSVTITAADIERSSALPGEGERISTCDYRFEVGERYVIYASRTPDGRWTTSMCAGTKPLADATPDLDYFADLSRAAPDAHVYGSITRQVRAPNDASGVTHLPAAGVRVGITGDTGRFTVTTDARGEYSLHVPPGDYAVAPIVPETIRVYSAGTRVSLRAYACAPVRFSLTANGRVEGRVVRPDGTPAKDTSVDLIPPDGGFDSRASLTAYPSSRTDADGRFAIDGVLPGRYRMAVNARFGPRLGTPYATSYLANGQGDARVIDIAEGERRTGFTLVVTPLAETMLSGRVVFADGQPVPDASVSAAPVDHRYTLTSSSKASSTGEFELPVLSGLTYVIKAGATGPNGYRWTEAVVPADGPREGIRLTVPR